MKGHKLCHHFHILPEYTDLYLMNSPDLIFNSQVVVTCMKHFVYTFFLVKVLKMNYMCLNAIIFIKTDSKTLQMSHILKFFSGGNLFAMGTIKVFLQIFETHWHFLLSSVLSVFLGIYFQNNNVSSTEYLVLCWFMIGWNFLGTFRKLTS